MARLLSYPSGVTKAPSSYVASLVNMQQLVSDLSNIPTDIAVNIMGEGMSAEYPTILDVGSYVLEGGCYVDWCGWPMGYLDQNGAWGNFVSTNFDSFLQSIGVSTEYIEGFYANGVGGSLDYGCSNAPYGCMWLSTYDFPTSDSVVVTTPDYAPTQCVGVYAYGMVAVLPPGGSGWYIYASPSVNECDLANFIWWVLTFVEPYTCSSSGGSSSGGAGNCPSGWTWSGGKCVQSSSGSGSPGSLCPTGYTLPAGFSAPGGCVKQSTQGSTAPTVNWWLIGGIGLAALGVIGAILVIGMEG